MSKSVTKISSSVDNSSVTSLPNNPPAGAKNALLAPNSGSAETVPRAASAPVVPTETSEAPSTIVSEAHEYANLFPMLGAVEFQALCEDIKKNGQLEPATSYKGKILDGRNRVAACRVLGIEPKIEELTINPLNLVIANNVRRRNLSKSQLAMVAVKLAFLADRPDLDEHFCAVSLEEAEEILCVSRAYAQHAQKVLAKAIPEVAALVETGKLPVNKAAKLADATPEQQREAVEIVKSGGKCPTFKPQEQEKVKLPTLKIQLTIDLQKALEHPMDSHERAEALKQLFKEISAEAFGKNNPRKEFLKGIVEECAEYGVVPSVVSDD